MSEKLDGVRAIWTGSELLTRNGNKIHTPDWFTSQLPAFALDGELFAGRGKFQAVLSAVQKHSPIDSEWNGLTYCAFDAPEVKGPFKARAEFLSKLPESNVLRAVNHARIAKSNELEAFHNEVKSLGGEGVIIRNPGAAHVGGRDGSMVKLKDFQSEEGEVEAFDGKSLLVKWRGVAAKIGSGLPDLIKLNPPIGERVTFNFHGLTESGLPRFATFVCVRNYE